MSNLHNEKAISKMGRKPTHGATNTSLFKRWMGMKQRCYLKSSAQYASYGGRGITVCQEWRESFVAFQHWALSHGYKKELRIDRADNNKGYSPENCRWVTTKQNNDNRRNTFKIPNGDPDEIAARLGITRGGLRYRMNVLGMDIETATTLPKQIGGNMKHFRKHHKVIGPNRRKTRLGPLPAPPKDSILG